PCRLPDVPLVLMAGIPGFDTDASDICLENQIDHRLQWGVEVVRSRQIPPADMQAYTVARDAAHGSIQRFDAALNMVSKFTHPSLETWPVEARDEPGFIELHDESGFHNCLVFEAHCVADGEQIL